MRGSARIYDVRMTQFVLKIEKLSHIMGARGSQDRMVNVFKANDNLFRNINIVNTFKSDHITSVFFFVEISA